MPRPATAAALGLLVLLLVVAVPASITVTEEPAQATYDLDTGDQTTVTQTLQIVVEDTTNQPDATITLRDTETLDSQTETMMPDNTTQYTIRNETIDVTLIAVEGSNANATVGVEYPRTYGWHAGAKTMVDNLPLAFVLVAFVVVVGGIGAALGRQ